MEFLHAYLGLMLCAAAIFTGYRTGQEGPNGAPGAVRVARTSAVPRPTSVEPPREAA